MHTQRAMPARCAPACGIRAPAVSGWHGGLVGLWVCGRLWSRATASRFVSALSQLNLSLSQLDLSFISAVSQHGNPAIPAAFRANSRLSHGYLTAISRLSPAAPSPSGHPALDTRGVVCIAEAARITRDCPARPLNAPFVPVPQVAFGTRRTALHDGAGNPLIHFTSLYPDPLLRLLCRSRPACARTARSARPDPCVTQFGLRVEQIQRKPRVRERNLQNAPRIRAGVTKKDQKAE